ncbi:MAG: hypothetical protein D6705_05350 [Deltaproteobacteria bacterium]|nr:MAG: hypothetical protein D6705_05350 [Deltaproteobacteria bacterium]
MNAPTRALLLAAGAALGAALAADAGCCPPADRAPPLLMGKYRVEYVGSQDGPLDPDTDLVEVSEEEVRFTYRGENGEPYEVIYRVVERTRRAILPGGGCQI